MFPDGSKHSGTDDSSRAFRKGRVLMKVLLICPWERPNIQLLADETSLAGIPLLGQSLVEYWMSHLAMSRVKEVLVLADPRAEQIQAIVGGGERWGLSVTVTTESRELTPAQALLKYDKELTPNAPLKNGIGVLDHFP